MRPYAHALLSAGFGLGIYGMRGDIVGAVACFATGTFLDIDHVYDCIKNLGIRQYNIWLKIQKKKLTSFCVFLHGWEYIFVLAGLAIYYDAPIITYIFFGYLSHIVADILFNPIRSVMSYSLCYRIIHRFDPYIFFADSVIVNRDANTYFV